MAKIRAKFRRVAEVFDEAVKARRPCESSGSEHSAADLSDLVNSFIERDNWEIRGDGEEIVDHHQEKEGNREDDDDQLEGYGFDSDVKDKLRGLFNGEDDGDDDDEVKRNIYAETEMALGVIGKSSSETDFKRRLMTLLRDRGFDAGLCKSKWERNGRLPSGDYQYIDLNVSGYRYIIEVHLAAEFQIARPSQPYTSILNVFPQIFVGKAEKMKQVVRVMGGAIRASLRSNGLEVPPWRKLRYMQAKWFGSYKRTVNEVSGRTVPDSDGDLTRKRWVGFKPLPAGSSNCRGDHFGSKVGPRVGLLAMAFKDTTVLL